MKKLYLILLSAILFSCSAKKHEEAVETSNDFFYDAPSQIIFRDEIAKYELAFPGFWTLEDHTKQNKMIRADIYLKDIIGFQIRKYDKVPNFQEFTNSYCENFITEMRGHWHGTIKEDRREFKKSNNTESCWVWIYAEKENGETWLFKEYLFKNNNTIIAFQSGILKQYQATYEKELDKIALSFKFMK